MHCIHSRCSRMGTNRVLRAARLLSAMVLALLFGASCRNADARKPPAAPKVAAPLRRFVIVSHDSRRLNIGSVDPAGNLVFEKYGGLGTQHPFYSQALEARGRFLFILTQKQDEIDVYRVTGKPGVRRANTVPIDKASDIMMIACHPSLDILYACSSKSITQYRILPDGGLKKADTPPVPAANCDHLQFDTRHNRAYAVSTIFQLSSSFYTFNLSRDGNLTLAAETPLGPEVTAAFPAAFIVDGAKGTLYVDTGKGPVYQYSIDATGRATAFSVPFVAGPFAGTSVLLGSGGKILRACGMCDADVWAYRVGPSGELTRWTQGDVTITQGIACASFDPVSHCYFFPIQQVTEIRVVHERDDGVMDRVRWIDTIPSPSILLIVNPPK